LPVPVPQLVKHLEDSGILAGIGGPGLLGKTLDYWIRADANWDSLPTNNDKLLLTNNKQ
jgi:hypothetical protein